MGLILSPDECGRQLADMFEAQVDICSRILECSQRQQILVRDRREDELLSLLGDKQKLIDEHQSLSNQSQTLREQWERDRAKADPEVVNDVENAWNALRDMLNSIVQLEDASRELLEEQKGQVSLDIGKLQRGKIVNKAYGGGVRPPPQARFSDKQG